VDDLERLGLAAQLSGREAEAAELCARIHQECLNRGDVERAARSAFWLAMSLLNRGDMARGGGWLARAHKVLDEGQRDCVEQGYLLVPEARNCLEEGDHEKAYALFAQAGQIAARFKDPDLMILSGLG